VNREPPSGAAGVAAAGIAAAASSAVNGANIVDAASAVGAANAANVADAAGAPGAADAAATAAATGNAVSPGAGMLLSALSLLAGQLFFNLGAAVAKKLFPVVGVEGMTAYRVGFSALILLAVFRPWRSPLSRADVLNLLVFGVAMGMMNLLIYKAFYLIPIGVAVAIEVTGPLTVALLGSRRPADFFAIALAGVGLWLLLPLAPGPGHLDPLGIAYALGAAGCWALYIVFGKRSSSMQGGRSVAWAMLVASFLVVPLGIGHAGATLLAPAVALTGLLVAVLSSAVPYSLEIVALRKLPQAVFGLLVSAAPAISALTAALVLGEHLNRVQWIAIGFIVAASALSAVMASRRARPPARHRCAGDPGSAAQPLRQRRQRDFTGRFQLELQQAVGAHHALVDRGHRLARQGRLATEAVAGKHHQGRTDHQQRIGPRQRRLGPGGAFARHAVAEKHHVGLQHAAAGGAGRNMEFG
jgi:inner membrane transporter RhtA